MPRKCPHCGKEVKYLTKHIKRNHPDKVGEAKKEETEVENNDKDKETNAETGDNQENPKGETLDIKAPEDATSGDFHCIECGASIQKGTATCPNCRTSLDWSAVG